MLSNRYITDRFLPDKAIDLVDEAASKIRMEMDSRPVELDEVERRSNQLKIEREALRKETDAGSRKRLARHREGDRRARLRGRAAPAAVGIREAGRRRGQRDQRANRGLKERITRAEQGYEPNVDWEQISKFKYQDLPELQKSARRRSKSVLRSTSRIQAVQG